MTLQIDTGQPTPAAPKQYDGRVTFRDQGTRAERKHRQIIAAIEVCESSQEVDDILTEEDLILDAMLLDYPDYLEAIKEAADGQKAILAHGHDHAPDAVAPAPIPAIANLKQSKESRMFTIDTGNEGGSRGPWLTWTSNGSAEKGFAPRSWILRGKDENDEKFEKVVPAFTTGCVMDLDSLQLGWEKDGAKGQAPERRWNPSISQATPRPDDSKNANGKFAWKSALSVRCAIGGGQAATWEQSAYGAYDAFSKVAKQIAAEWPERSQNGKMLPLIKQVGVDAEALTSGNSNKPVLQVVDWVERPACLKDDAPTIATAPAPAPAPVTPTVQPAPASTVPAAGAF
jgi:hypothetical protein